MQEWLLNLCFTCELKQTRETEGKAPSVVEVALVVGGNEKHIGDVVEQAYDPTTMRMRALSLTHGRLHRRAAQAHVHTASDPEALADLWKQPGLKELYDEFVEEGVTTPSVDYLVGRFARFNAYQRHTIQFHPTRPQYFRCTSMGSFGEPIEVYLYVPPLQTNLINVPLSSSMSQLAFLPLAPTLYKSADEAAYVPMVQQLWSGDDVLKDYAVGLVGNGATGIPAARVQFTGYRDGNLRGLPFALPGLRGTLKQVAWASEIRVKAIEALKLAKLTLKLMKEKKPARRPEDPSIEAPYDDAVTVLKPLDDEAIAKIEAELEFAEEAKGWIDHRRTPFRWLEDRARTRSNIDSFILKEGS